MGSAALLARGADWISGKTDNMAQFVNPNRVAPFTPTSGKRAQSAPHLLGAEMNQLRAQVEKFPRKVAEVDHFPLKVSDVEDVPLKSSAAAHKREGAALENEIAELRRSLNLPKDAMSQAVELFQKHADKPDKESSLLKNRWLTKIGFAKVWFEMTGQEDESASGRSTTCSRRSFQACASV